MTETIIDNRLDEYIGEIATQRRTGAGTGTFLAETVRHIRAKFSGQEGMWPGYVRDHLVPRLNGFEILMASYAMAHLKLDMLLGEGFPAAENAKDAEEDESLRSMRTLRQNENARLGKKGQTLLYIYKL